MNPLLKTALSYARELATALRSPQVRSQLQAVLQSAEMKTLLGTVRDTVGGAAPAAQDPPSLTQNQPNLEDPASGPTPAMTGRARRRAQAKQQLGDS